MVLLSILSIGLDLMELHSHGKKKENCRDSSQLIKALGVVKKGWSFFLDNWSLPKKLCMVREGLGFCKIGIFRKIVMTTIVKRLENGCSGGSNFFTH